VTRVAGESQGQAEPDVVPAVLAAASALSGEHAAAMLRLYEKVRQAHQGNLARLRDVEAQLEDVSHRIGSMRTIPINSLDPQQVLDLLELEDRLQPLSQQQEWLAEQLVLEASAGRKIQAVVHQAELAAAYLGGSLGEGGGITDLAELAEFQMLQAHEDERRRLARDIHDGPAQVLANAVFGLEWCKRMLDRDPSQLAAELENIEHDLRTGLDEVRQCIYDLSPVSFSEVGLGLTLRRYLHKFNERTGILADLSIESELDRLTAQVEIGVFRIIQEALQNVRKHSRARTVQVTVVREDALLRVVVEDNGVGFERSASPTGGAHFGMVSMSERARLLHGELGIDSKPGRGTRVSFTVPLSELTDDM